MEINYFIPVRKGSKEIPDKNMKFLGDKPLVSHIIDAVIATETKDNIWIATDCAKLKKYVSNLYKERIKIFDRSAKNASDTSPTINVVLEFLAQNKVSKDSYFVLLQATSPFTTALELKNLITFLHNNSGNYDSVISCCRLKRFRWEDDGNSVDYNLTSKPRRQDYKGFLIESGAFYVSKVKDIIASKQLISGNIFPMEVSSEGMIELDSLLDWNIAETILKHKQLKI